MAGPPAWLLAHQRLFGALALAFMAFWVGLSVLVALQEPSLGWRFAPDPQGQGLLAYAPSRAVKVGERERAEARFIALRRLPGPDGTPPPVLALDSLVAVEAPSMLKRQEDLDRFFDLQARAWALLAAAQAAGEPVQLQRPDGVWVTRSVRERGWDELGWLYAVPLLCGMVPFVVGMGVCAWRWHSAGARYLGLASVMALLALAEVAVVTGRLWLLPPWFAEAGQTFVRCTSLVAVWAFVMMLLHYPTPLPRARTWARGSGAGLLALLVLNVLQWPADQALRYKLWLVVASLAFVALAVWQSLSHRADPVHRAAGRWLAASALVAFSVVIYAFVVSLVYDVQVVSNSYRWVSVPLLYIGLMVSVGRANLFELERWWLPLVLWYLGGTLVVLTDLALVALLQLDGGAALTLALLVAGWLYFPLRQGLLARLQASSRPQVMAHLPDLMGAVNAGLAGEGAARQAWQQLLVRVFDPAGCQDEAGARAQAAVDDLGRALLVPDVGGQGAWRLTLARQGRQLFTGEHARVAQELWQLLELGLSQQRQTQHAVERERQRIAADLHDDLGARLLSLVQAGAADGTAVLARQALEDMRQSVRGMAGRPVPAEVALADWRAELVGRLQGAGFSVDWAVDEPPAALVLAPRLHLQLTRVLREAVSNLIRHSGGRRARVAIRCVPPALELAVEDDGRGLPPPGQRSEGLGLGGIERRVRQLGGEHRFGPSPLGGLGLWVRVPLAAPAEPPPAPPGAADSRP